MISEKVTILGIELIKETDDEGRVFMYKDNGNPIDNPKLKTKKGVGYRPVTDPKLNT